MQLLASLRRQRVGHRQPVRATRAKLRLDRYERRCVAPGPEPLDQRLEGATPVWAWRARRGKRFQQANDVSDVGRFEQATQLVLGFDQRRGRRITQLPDLPQGRGVPLGTAALA